MEPKPGALMSTPPIVGGSTTNASGASTPGVPPVFDLQKLARDRSLWPKKVILKKPVTFPAVVNGKVVGNLVAPVGTEANLMAIKDGKLGSESKAAAPGWPWRTRISRRAPAR